MKALVLKGKDEALSYEEWTPSAPEEGSVQVNLKASALNHRDIWITKGMYPGIQYPIILGSDGAGTIGDREVIINPGIKWGENPRAQQKSFEVLGLPRNGTFADAINIPEEYVFDKPAHLSWEEAAALPLAGLTAYRSLFTQGKITKGDKVLINGVGGGVALIAFQMAVALGAEVYVTSGSEEKLERASKMGAAGATNYKEELWHKTFKKTHGGVDLVIDSAGGAAFMPLVDICNPGARIVFYGGSLGKVKDFSPQKVFWKQLHLIGSTMGSPQDFQDMLTYLSQHEIKPVVDKVFELAQGQEAFNYLESGQQFGKVVLKH